MRAPAITLKTEQDIEKLRISGRLAAQVLEMIGEHVKPGVTTEYLDDICHDFIVNTLKVTPANIGYYGYTKTTCISPNEVVCHGIPSPNTVLQDGDIINIDVAIIKDGCIMLVHHLLKPNVWSKPLMKLWLPGFMPLNRAQP